MMPRSSDETHKLYEEVAEGLADAGVTKGKMFGVPCLKVGRKVIGGLWGEAMNFKLPPDARAEALAIPGAEPFDPGKGRPMREWVVVPVEHADRWPELAHSALGFVRGD
jgi:hypothetical protein